MRMYLAALLVAVVLAMPVMGDPTIPALPSSLQSVDRGNAVPELPLASPRIGPREGEILPDGRLVGTPQGELPATQADIPALMTQWQTANRAANDSSGDRASRLRQQANALALQISSLKSRVDRLEKANAGGPAAEWAKPQVEETLGRGADRGGLIGRHEGASVKDAEWQSAMTRQEAAVAISRLASYAERLAQKHNEDENAHPLLQQAIAGEEGARKRSDQWLWVAALSALLVGLIGWFLPRIRAVVTPEEETEEEEIIEEEEPAPEEGG